LVLARSPATTETSQKIAQVLHHVEDSPQGNFGTPYQSAAAAMLDKRVCEILTFVCRFEGATARNPKQNLTQFGKAKDSVKAKR
jgi:hypothetical protein